MSDPRYRLLAVAALSAAAFLSVTGAIGAGLFILLLVYWSRNAWLLWSSRQADIAMREMGLLFLALMAVYVANAMFHDVSIMPMVNMLVFFMAGVTRGALHESVAPRCGLVGGTRPRLRASAQATAT